MLYHGLAQPFSSNCPWVFWGWGRQSRPIWLHQAVTGCRRDSGIPEALSIGCPTWLALRTPLKAPCLKVPAFQGQSPPQGDSPYPEPAHI